MLEEQENTEKSLLETPYNPKDIEKELAVGDTFTDQQDMFMDIYMTCFDPKKAAEEAKYSPWVVRMARQKILNIPKIRAEIDRRKALDRSSREDLNERVFSAWEKIAFADIKEAYNEDGSLKPISEIPDDLMFAIESIDSETRFEGRGDEQVPVHIKKIRLGKKLESLRDIAKATGMFAEDNKLLVDIGFKGVFDALPKEQREVVKLALLKRIENKKK